jgi:hypothetical protein
MMLLQLIVVTAPVAVSAFTTTTTRSSKMCSQTHRLAYIKRSRPLCSVPPNNNEEKAESNDGLVLDGLNKEMSKVASQFSFSEMDFLAAAKKRAEERVESKNASAGDKDWKTLAEEKNSEYGEIDDWDNSMKEAGNQDSQILMFTDPPADGEDEGGEGAEPKLLLF